MWRPKVLRYLLHEDLFFFWIALFFIGLGLLLQVSGTKQFYYKGTLQDSAPFVFYWVSAPFIGLGLLRIWLFRIERAKQARKAQLETKGPRRRQRRHEAHNPRARA